MPGGSVSGIEVPDSVREAIDALKKDNKYQYVVFHLKSIDTPDGKGTFAWEVKSLGERIPKTEKKQQINIDCFLPCYEEFVEKELRPDCAVYAVYDFACLQDVKLKDRLNLVGFQWCPDCNIPVKAKMCFASSVEALKKECGTSIKVITQNEKAEVNFFQVTGLCQDRCK